MAIEKFQEPFESIFPPEVWAKISVYLDVCEVGHLYVGSNRAIRYALHVGVTHLVDWSDVPFETKHFYRPVRHISATFISRFVYLQQLHLPYNTNLQDKDMHMMLHDHLKYLDLSCNEELTDFGLSSLPRFLEALHLKFSTNITDASMPYLPKTLKVLDLDRCKNITDEGLKNLPPALETLNLTFARKITDEGVSMLPKTLKHLQLAMNKAITRRGVKSLPSKLEILDLSHNVNLAGTTRNDFPPHLKLLCTLYH
jgi:hypothetical protein